MKSWISLTGTEQLGSVGHWQENMQRPRRVICSLVLLTSVLTNRKLAKIPFVQLVFFELFLKVIIHSTFKTITKMLALLNFKNLLNSFWVKKDKYAWIRFSLFPHLSQSHDPLHVALSQVLRLPGNMQWRLLSPCKILRLHQGSFALEQFLRKIKTHNRNFQQHVPALKA